MLGVTAFSKVIYEYSQSCSPHGISYIFKDKQNFLERFLWMVAVIIASYFCINASINVYNDFMENPVIVTLESIDEPISSIEFPAITICSQVNSILS